MIFIVFLKVFTSCDDVVSLSVRVFYLECAWVVVWVCGDFPNQSVFADQGYSCLLLLFILTLTWDKGEIKELVRLYCGKRICCWFVCPTDLVGVLCVVR